MTRNYIPASGNPDVVWPALPYPSFVNMFALLQQFEHSQWWPADVLEHYQLRQLESLAGHAARTVPFYKSRLKCLEGIRPGELTVERWREIPVMGKTHIQDSFKDLCSRALPRDHLPLGEVSTSGSTGRPITVKATRLTKLFFDAAHLRYHMWHGRDFGAKICAVKVSNSAESSNWVTGYRSGPMTTMDISNPVSKQFEWLMREAPDYLLTYPNNLKALLDLSAKSGERIANLSQVVTMSDVLDAGLRDDCRHVWGVPVSDAYSAQEVGLIALQCPEYPVYHLQSESNFTEILAADGSPCGPGETGRVVVTDLVNFASPLIRYDIGDYAEVGRPCRCGRGLPVLNRIMGRSRNMLRLPSGDQFWPRFGSGHLLKIAPIRQQQLVQVSVTEIHVNLVVERALTDQEETAVHDRILASLRHPFRLVFHYVDDIPRSANGKFEDFMSRLED